MANDDKSGPKRDPLLDEFEAFLGPDLEDRPYRLGESPNSHSRWDETRILRSLAESRGFPEARLESNGLAVRVNGEELHLFAYGTPARLRAPLALGELPGLAELTQSREETLVYQLKGDSFRLELPTVAQTFRLTRAATADESARLVAAVTEAWYRGDSADSLRGSALKEKYEAGRRAGIMNLPRAANATPVELNKVKVETASQQDVDDLLRANPGKK